MCYLSQTCFGKIVQGLSSPAKRGAYSFFHIFSNPFSFTFDRFENEVMGLPNKGNVKVGGIGFLYPNFPLRLYALRVNNRPDLVVLSNGGVKSAQTNQGSGNLILKWREACQFAKRIEEALRNKKIIVDYKKIKFFNNPGP